MINTNMSAYLQNVGIQKSNLGQAQTSKNQNIEKENNADGVNVVISPQSKAMLKIDDLQKQLDDIFGVKKELNSDELKREKELKTQISNLKTNVELPYSKEDMKTIQEIDKQIKEILKKEYHSYQDDDKLFKLSKQIHNISNKYESPSLSQSNTEKVAELVAELRTLQGYKNPDFPELIDAEKIYTQMDMVKIGLEIIELDKNSDTYAADFQTLQDKLSTSMQSIDKLDTSKVEYEQEETRENAKNSIKNSLANIRAMQNSFFNGTLSSMSASGGQPYGQNIDNSGATNDNKWLDFLQSTRKDLFTGLQDQDYTKNNESDLASLVSRARVLHS